MPGTKKSEEITKGLTSGKLSGIDGYPSVQNVRVNGITWFKEDSYKGTDYDWLGDIFSKASKKQTLKSKGTPDFIVVKESSNVIIVIECKGNIEAHSNLSDVGEYKAHECRGTSFVWPKGGNIIDIEVLEDTYLENASLSICQYEEK